MKLRLALATGLLATAAAVPAPATAADPTMPLADVRAGMRCTSLSVVRGTTISEFDAEVIDVVRGEPSGAGPRILIRVSGPAIDATGIGPGFSGSPVICPDRNGARRNAGAISESVGEYGNKLALVTPIEFMLGQGPRAPRSARRAPALMRSARPIATPLTISGLSSVVRSHVLRAAQRARRPVLAAPSKPFTGYPVQNLRPGAAVAASLSSGDVSISAIGTVTYRDGPSVWGFGHSFEGFGRRALLLQDAYVFSVIGNPAGTDGGFTYKLAAPGHIVGALTNDNINAIVGRVGPPPRTVALRTTVLDTDRDRSVTVRSQATDERELDLGSSLSLVGSIELGEAIIGAMESSPIRLTSSMCVRIDIRERRRPLGFCNDYFDGDSPFEDLSTAFVLLDAFKYGRITPVSARVRMRVRRGVEEALMLRARAPRTVRQGQRIRIRIALRRRRGGFERLSVPYRVPLSTRPGRRTLTLRGTVPFALLQGFEQSIEDLLGGGVGGGLADEDLVGPRSVETVARAIAGLKRRYGLRATFSRKSHGPVILPTRERILRGKLRLPMRVLERP